MDICCSWYDEPMSYFPISFPQSVSLIVPVESATMRSCFSFPVGTVQGGLTCESSPSDLHDRSCPSCGSVKLESEQQEGWRALQWSQTFWRLTYIGFAGQFDLQVSTV